MPNRWRETLQPRSLIATVALVALVGSVGIEILAGTMRQAHDVRAELGEVTSLVNQHSALEWQAVAQGASDASLWDAVEANVAAISTASAALLTASRDAPEVADLIALVGRYCAAVDDMARLIRRGDIDGAEAVDDELVDPLFDTIHQEAGALSIAYTANAEALSIFSRVGTTGLVAGSALAVTFFAGRSTRRNAEARLEGRFRSLVQNSSDLVTIIARDGSITYEGPSIERLLGRPSWEDIGIPFASLIHPDDIGRLERLIEGARARNGSIGATEIVRIAHADGSWRQFETVARNLEDDPDVGGIVLTARDATERERLANRVRYQAAHDELTGLANRRTFLDRVDAGLAGADHLAVLFIDLDDFKGMNDNLGHSVGDRVLRIVADRLRSTIRPTDLAARLGGDEFGILLTGVETNIGPEAAAERLLEAINAPLEVGSATLRLSASIGIAVGRSGAHSTDVITEADLAMYAAKRMGGGRHSVFEPSLLAASRERMGLRGELEGAVDRGELVLHYQPIVALPRGEIKGVEALVRWLHPTRGLIAPDVFIPIAEEGPLISQIGEWVLREATAALASWRQTPAGQGLSISVNVSPRQLADAAFADRVSEILDDVHLPARCLVLEITESVFADPSPSLSANLDQLRARGIQIAIDDFGTGFSSLGYLPRLPVDVLKIDRVFVGGPDGSLVDPALAAAIIQMADAFFLRTVAEGVETEAQLDRLCELGCHMAQGYLFSRPVPAEAFAALLRSGPLGPSVPRLVQLSVVSLAS
jgi:diguanylate cyclase (GGDEF)-like protein/PAS domain S-box-containing protein